MTSRSCEPPVIRPKAQAPRRSDREANRILPTDEQNKLKESVEKKPCYWGKKRIILERPALKSRSRKREWVWVRPGGKEKGKPASDAPPVCNRHRRSSPACWIRSEEHKRYAPKCVRDDQLWHWLVREPVGQTPSFAGTGTATSASSEGNLPVPARRDPRPQSRMRAIKLMGSLASGSKEELRRHQRWREREPQDPQR